MGRGRGQNKNKNKQQNKKPAENTEPPAANEENVENNEQIDPNPEENEENKEEQTKTEPQQNEGPGPQNTDQNPEKLEIPNQENQDNSESPKTEEKSKEMDPRAILLNEQLVQLLNAAQGIWKDALESQVRLTVKADYLQESLDQIKQLSALPNYPAGMRQLQNSINRVQTCRKRITAVQNRLNKLNLILNPPKPKN